MPWVVELLPKAVRELRDLDPQVRQRVARAIDALAQDPFAGDVKRLKGGSCLYRRREGDYSILFTLEQARVRVIVVRVGHRRQVYTR